MRVVRGSAFVKCAVNLQVTVKGVTGAHTSMAPLLNFNDKAAHLPEALYPYDVPMMHLPPYQFHRQLPLSAAEDQFFRPALAQVPAFGLQGPHAALAAQLFEAGSFDKQYAPA